MCATGQETPKSLCSTNIYTIIQLSPVLVALLSHIYPVRIFPSYFFKFILILSPHLGLGLTTIPFISGLRPKWVI